MESDKRSSSTPRKVRFPPKGPPRRAVKPPQVKSEAVKEGGADEDEKRALLQAVTKHLAGGQTKAEKKSAPKQVAFSHVVASSTTSTIGTHGGLQGGTDEITNDKGLKGSASGDGILENVTDPLLKKKKKEYKEPWDYRTNYPTSLPWRKPFSGDPELLDEDEFGEAASAREYDERNLNDASDLGLLEKVDDAKMYLFQIPATIPYGGAAKMLVYKSGVVKLKMGDFLFLVSPGIDSSFHQDIMAVTTNEKQCCSLGKPNNTWAVVTPDIE